MPQVEEKWMPISRAIVKFACDCATLDREEIAQAVFRMISVASHAGARSADHVPEGATPDYRVEECAMWLRMAVRQLQKGSNGSKAAKELAEKIVEYLERKGLKGSILREEPKHFVCIGCKCGPHAFVDQHSPHKGDEFRLEPGTLSDEDLTLIRIEAYRSGYSAGYSDGKNGERMRDKDAAGLFYGVNTPDIFVDQHAPKETPRCEKCDWVMNANRYACPSCGKVIDLAPSQYGAGADPGAEAQGAQAWNGTVRPNGTVYDDKTLIQLLQADLAKANSYVEIFNKRLYDAGISTAVDQAELQRWCEIKMQAFTVYLGESEASSLRQQVAAANAEVDHFSKQNLAWAKACETWKARAEAAEKALGERAGK